MPQSNAIFAFLFVAFLIFVTLRGHLPQYIELLRGGGNPDAGTDGDSGSSGNGWLDKLNPFKDENNGALPPLPEMPTIPSPMGELNPFDYDYDFGSIDGKTYKSKEDAIIDLFEAGDTFGVFDANKARDSVKGK